jgi:cytochrome b
MSEPLVADRQGLTSPGEGQAKPDGKDWINVWDPLLRLFHWSLVVAFFTSFFIVDNARVHEGVGYVVLGLLAFRVVWGLVGPHHARFASFLKPPAVIRDYLSDLGQGLPARYLGHNPAGGVMIVALMIAVTLTAGSGWLSTTERFWGVGWVETVHEVSAWLTLSLVGVHVVGAITASLLHRENLILAMITGRKRA